MEYLNILKSERGAIKECVTAKTIPEQDRKLFA